MPLSDREIKDALKKGEISIEPLRQDAIQPSSVDVTLGPIVKVIKPDVALDLARSAEDAYVEVDLTNTEYVLPPGGFVLGACEEYINFGPYCGIVMNRTSFARLGLDCALSSYANPGYEGTLPLAIVNQSGRPVKLVPYRRVAQVLFMRVGEVDVPYKDRAPKYFQERGPTGSRHHLDPDLENVLLSMGLRGRSLEKAKALLDERLEKAAEQLARQHGEGSGG